MESWLYKTLRSDIRGLQEWANPASKVFSLLVHEILKRWTSKTWERRLTNFLCSGVSSLCIFIFFFFSSDSLYTAAEAFTWKTFHLSCMIGIIMTLFVWLKVPGIWNL